MYSPLPFAGNTGEECEPLRHTEEEFKTPSPTALPLYSPTGNTEGEFKCNPTTRKEGIKRREGESYLHFSSVWRQPYRGDTEGRQSRGEGLKKIN